MEKFSFLAVAVVGLLIFPAGLAFAASAQLTATSTGPVILGQEVAIELFLDTAGKAVNALSGEVKISFSGDIELQASSDDVTISRIHDGDSIVGAWLVKAKSDDTRRVNFSGIIPGGVTTAHGKIMTLYVVPRYSGVLRLTMTGTTFEHTLLGEAEQLSSNEIAFPVGVFTGAETPALAPEDITPPQDIRAVIYQSEGMFDGQPFIIIHAKDAESGIATYELLETGERYPDETLKNDRGLTWRLIDNLAPLVSSANSGYIYVRVTDREGNASVVEVNRPVQLSPENGQSLFNKWLISFILIVAAGLFLLLWGRKRKRHAQ
ncbi:MAG: hypothetical protein A2942_02185 [Candidatus Lloydbacteria bacterium RIFCSPLOWO2_01_FULL_50_20]|uniref:Cohesin domain-containing protein n=1 Tax=Candidatus Lloydbacteria bacterium RIFCSPLOWO2_01_FULL_50_20 TaxID=1798665 RepID=A0A1G2DJH9_9BACT|nr:MAG: hypothetical protein A3C13_04755 [Candidatus Lloydbacteria bacterium RIFCSPHIGHO2_02_FULL_50_11]OGZ13759.1 MAG: hypothetical protein A2942_02185 [Candidatus Lloydbacteria bacterium RIFCSPLOWO2_01_FULL_50_20]